MRPKCFRTFWDCRRRWKNNEGAINWQEAREERGWPGEIEICLAYKWVERMLCELECKVQGS